MPAVMIAGIAVENTSFHFDKLYDYAVPQALVPKVQRGVRVQVPFGSGDSRRVGIVMDVHSGRADHRLKSIAEVVDESPLLSEEMCLLAEYMKAHTFCTIYDAVKSMVPFGINLKIVAQYAPGERAGEDLGDALDETEKQIVSFVVSQKKNSSAGSGSWRRSDWTLPVRYRKSCGVPDISCAMMRRCATWGT